MYQIKKSENRISPLHVRQFSDLGFTERNHLQEWLRHCPNALGEELLIIQKEFDGFDETNERLDLLAIDTDGNLVIIENKLDDSGRDVVWQSLKYASYCSSLTKSNVLTIFQEYLNKHEPNKDAKSILCSFLGKPDLDEIVLNTGTKQRLMLVAANFRKEVTSTALWLLKHGVNIQCFKVTPYSLDEQLFLNVEQIIPTPEAKELMIGISAKEADEKSTEAELKQRHTIRLKFWEQALEALKQSKCALFNNINPTKDHWLNAGSGVRGVGYMLIFNKDEARVEIYMSRSDASENKYIFDKLSEQKEFIEKNFGEHLTWEKLDSKKACRIKYSHDFDGYNESEWPQITSWLIENMYKLEKAFKTPLADVNEKLKSKG